MTPQRSPFFSAKQLRRDFLLALSVSAMCGCAMPLIRGQTPDPEELTQSVEAAEPESSSTIKLVRDVANSTGLRAQRVESVALVTQLAGTGSDPPAGTHRQMLIDEMQTHDVRNPNKLLASPNTSLVLVQAYLPAGCQKGDRIDVQVGVPPRSETASLRGGWLMQTRLRPIEQLGGQLRSGHIIALAEGSVLVDAAFKESDDKVLLTRGRVLGGGIAQISRPLGLLIKEGNNSIATASLVGTAINARFHHFDHGKKKGVANPKSDTYIELALQPRYKQNVWRYMQVVRNVPLRESASDRLARLDTLQLKLLEPSTSSEAALQLEAIGKESLPILKKGIQSKDPEVRFYSAESLAYLEQAEAAPVLAEAAQSTAAFRSDAIIALAAMDHIAAYDALTGLLHVSSAEARYGAFRALRLRNPRDPLVRGEILGEGGTVSYHVVPTTGEPMVHFAKSQRPEIVLFTGDLQMTPPSYLDGGKNRDILVKEVDSQHIKVVRFASGRDDNAEVCSTELTQIIPAILKVGGDYTDVMQIMQQARKKGYLTAKIAVDALPKAGRIYDRSDAESEEMLANDDSTDPSSDKSNTPRSEWPQNDSQGPEYDFNLEQQAKAKRGFFGRITHWFATE